MNNLALVTETKILCKKETKINAQIIRNLTLISESKIHIELGFGSLFDFCVGELGLSPASAQRKIDAVRISLAVPDLADRIEKGEITQSKVSQVSKFLREEKRYGQRTFTKAQVKALVTEVQSSENDHESQKILSQKSELVNRPVKEIVRVLSGGRQTLQIEVDDEFLDLLKQVRDLVSHEGYQSHSQILKKALRFFLSKKHPEKVVAQRFVSNESKISKNKRFVSAPIRRAVWKTNHGKCAFTDPITNKRCGSTFRLQIEHIKPIALGGRSTEDNLTLYCQAHNLFAASKLGLHRHHQVAFSNT